MLRWAASFALIAVGTYIMLYAPTSASTGRSPGRAGIVLIAGGLVLMMFGGRSTAQQRGYRDG